LFKKNGMLRCKCFLVCNTRWFDQTGFGRAPVQIHQMIKREFRLSRRGSFDDPGMKAAAAPESGTPRRWVSDGAF
jgi:hypothetical protein